MTIKTVELLRRLLKDHVGYMQDCYNDELRDKGMLLREYYAGYNEAIDALADFEAVDWSCYG